MTQASDLIMLKVLMNHQLCVAWEDEASQGITCLCGLELPTEKVRGEIDMDFLAAHQAQELDKAGYGSKEDAYDEGFTNAENEHDGFTGVSGWANHNPYRRQA